MTRFIVVNRKEASKYDDPNDLTYDYGFGERDYAGYLVDTQKGEVLFCDAGEPEDANLSRDYNFLVGLLNEVSADGSWVDPCPCGCTNKAELHH